MAMDRRNAIERTAEVQAARMKRPYGRCLEASERLTEALGRRGIEARILRCCDGMLVAPEADRRWLSLRRAPRSWVHYVVEVDGIVVDLTRRQFYPDAPNPYYCDIRSLAAEWHTIENTAYHERLAS